MVVGTGVQNYTDIVAQLTGTTGLDGTYDVYSSIGPDSTPPQVALSARVKDAVGYAGNAAEKPDDGFIIRVGHTVTDETFNQVFGYDPQKINCELNKVNAVVISVDLTQSPPFGNIALGGDISHPNPGQFFHAPIMTPGSGIVWGCQGPGGGGTTNGRILRGGIVMRFMDDAEVSAFSTALTRKYRPI
jgi:hypothetical protein